MARGRMLSKSISTNKRLGLAGPDPALAWFLSLPHADIQGCLPGSIRELEMVCFPVAISFFGWTHERIEDLLNLLVLHGFWRLVVDDIGQKAIYIERFGDHQTIRPDQDKKSNFIFSKGVENSAALSPKEWRGISEIPPNFRGISAEFPRDSRGVSSADSPRILGENSAQSKLSKSKEKEEESDARARVKALSVPEPPIGDNYSPGDQEKPRASFEASGSRKQEISMIHDQVVADFRAAHPMGEGAIIREHFDRPALHAAAHVLAEMKDRRGFFRRAISSLPPHRLTLEACLEKLNDPSIVNGSRARAIDSSPSPLIVAQAEMLGITPVELQRRYESGEMTVNGPQARTG